MKRKSIFLLFLVMLVLCLLPVGSGLANSDTITVYVSIVDQGEFVTGSDEDSTLVVYAPVEVADQNANSGFDVDDVLYAAHEAFYPGGAAEGYDRNSMVTKFWGTETSGCGYYVNNVSSMGLADPISEDDHIYAFIYTDQSDWSDLYSYFDQTTAKVAGGEELTLTLNACGMMSPVSPYKWAEITIDGEKTHWMTNDEGQVTISFSQAGTYLVSAVSDSDILTPAICFVTVAGEDESAAIYVAEDKAALTLPATVTEDLALPKTGQSGKTRITWESSKPQVISHSGKVTRSATEEEVTLTATITCGAITDSKTFTLTVPALSDAELLAAAVAALTEAAPITPNQWNASFDGPGDTDITQLAQSLVDEVVSGVTVGNTVTSLNANVAEDGSITYTNAEESGDVTFSLSIGEENTTVTVNVTVAALTQTRQAELDRVAALVADAILKDNASLSDIRSDLDLSLNEIESDTIFFSLISAEFSVPQEYQAYLKCMGDIGDVTRPAYGAGDASFNLEVTLTWDSMMDSIMGDYLNYVGPIPEDKEFSIPITIAAFTEEEYQGAKTQVDEALAAFSTDSITYFADKTQVANLSAVTENLMLPSVSGFSAEWTTSDPDVVAAPSYKTGRAVVTRPGVGEADASCTLTLTLSLDGYSNSKEIPVTVKALTEEEIATEQAKIQQVADALTFDVIRKDNLFAAAVSTDLDLWRSAELGESIAWSKSASPLTGYAIDWEYTENIGQYGKVTQGEEDVQVNLKATVYSADKGSYTQAVDVVIPMTILGTGSDGTFAMMETLLENIAASYTESTEDWQVMDMGAYAAYAPASSHQLTESAKAAYLASATAAIASAEKDTDIAKAALGLSAIGVDVTTLDNDGATLNAITELNGMEQSSSVWRAPYTLAAYNQGDYDTDAYEQALLDALLAAQNENGSWTELGDSAQSTANVLAALAFYQEEARVAAAIEKAVNFLGTQQQADGSFDAYGDGADANTQAMVIVGLAAVGVNPDTDARFIKNGNSVLDALLSFALADGSGFGYQDNTKLNPSATEQGFRALISAAQIMTTGNAYNVYDFYGNAPSVTLRETVNGTISVDNRYAKAEDIVTITVNPALGFALDELQVMGKDGAVAWQEKQENVYTFTMPEGSVVISATFKAAEDAVDSVVKAMEALTVKDASEKTLAEIEAIQSAYAELTQAEKEEISAEYAEFQAKVEAFSDYLDDAILDAKDELEEYFDKLDEDDYTASNWKKIEAIYEDALDDLDRAETEEEVADILKDAKRQMDAVKEGSMEVSFRLIGDFVHDKASKHEEYVTWIETTDYELDAGDTVYDLFRLALDDAGLDDKGASNNYVTAIQAPDILGGYWLEAEDNGPNSGWQYTVNGKHPSSSMKDYELEDGDEVIWHYVDDYADEEDEETWLEAEDISPKEYAKDHLDDILSVGAHGSVSPKLSVNDLGDDVTFTFTPDDGYKVLNVKVDGVSKGAITKYTYKDLALDSRISVTFTSANGESVYYYDVNSSDWYDDAVQYMTEEGLMDGLGNNYFGPGEPMSRAMLVTVLYRLDGSPKVSGNSNFLDVASGQWYTDACIWAEKNGIVTGYDNGYFGVGDNITREQMATILYRYTTMQGYSLHAGASLNQYTDTAQISAYARTAMEWAVGEGLITGRTTSTLVPQGYATRGELAEILYRYCEQVVK